MDVSVLPVVRGEFVYRDTLLVDVGGEGKRHPRAPEAELRNLLNGKAPKDQVSHYYAAQLIHYGLQRSNEKNTAKVRLQQALSQGKLKGPPPHIVDMEGQMKKDYASAVRKAKSQNKSAPSTVPEKPAPKGQKRKNDSDGSESAKRTKFSMNVGELSINIEHSAAQASKKKTSTKEAKATPKAIPSTDSKDKNAGGKSKPLPSSTTSKSKTADNSNNTAISKAKSTPSKTKPAKAPEPSAQSPAKQTAKAKAEPKIKPEPKVRAETQKPTQSKVKAEPGSHIKLEPGVKEEPNSSRPSPIKKEKKVKREQDDSSITPNQDDGDARIVTGVYNISCPQIEEQIPESTNNLRVFLCVDADKISGSFNLAMKSGVLRIDYSGDGNTTFGWRAKDNWEEDRMSFGRGCFGDIEFHAPGQIRGTFYNLFPEPVVFEGWRRPGPLWCGRSAYSFEQEWEGYVVQAYGR